MDSSLFWRSLLVQTAATAALVGLLLALPLPGDLFEDYGFVAGPLAWIVASLVTARVLALPLVYALFAAAAGGVAGVIVMLVASHWPGVAAALLVFAASCGSYERGADEPAPPARVAE